MDSYCGTVFFSGINGWIFKNSSFLPIDSEIYESPFVDFMKLDRKTDFSKEKKRNK